MVIKDAQNSASSPFIGYGMNVAASSKSELFTGSILFISDIMIWCPTLFLEPSSNQGLQFVKDVLRYKMNGKGLRRHI